MKTLIRLLALLAVLLAAPHIHSAETGGKKKGAETKTKSAGKVDINTADAATLQTLPGVGPATADAIIAARPFASIDDLARVPGIGAAKLADLRPHVRASKADVKGGEKKGKGDAKKSEKAKEKASTKTSSRGAETDTRSSTTTAPRGAGRIDINTADQATLETLPGVGATTAKAIVAARPFNSVDDLERVPGIGPARLAELRDRVTVSRRSAEKKSSAPAKERERERELEPTGRVSTPRSNTPGEAAPARTATTRQGLVNLNTASREELEALPEIGPVKAEAIIEARPFSSIEDVMRVKGIKEATFEAIKDQITVR